jgi:general L-amino acid transport system permease protein
MASRSVGANDHAAIPFYRNIRVIAVLLQIMFVIVIAVLFWWLLSNMFSALQRSRIPLGFGFLRQVAGFEIAEGIRFDPTDTYARAFLVGIVNTIRVAVIGIVLATTLGVVVGVSRLSSNWLLRTVAASYVAFFRNIPLLLQLLFWWSLILYAFPRVREAIGIPGWFLASNRGLVVAWPRVADSFGAWQFWLWAGVLVAIVVYVARRAALARADRPGSALPHALLASGVTVLIGFFVVLLTTGNAPLRLDQPQFGNFNFQGGASLTQGFAALLFGLTIYTSAFIAEVVRGGIQSVSKGQREAAQALALSQMQTLRLVIFPQALRVIIPPLTNQYLNLTKNSTLGIAIGYYDLFAVATTISNQSGAIVQVIVIIMACYLSVSLLTSLLMNLYNARIRLVER